MPKSRNKRKGKNRARRDGTPTFVQMVGGRPIRFVAKLPQEGHPEQLEDELGDDAQAKLLAFVAAGVAPEDRAAFDSALEGLRPSDIQDLGSSWLAATASRRRSSA